MSDSEQRRFDHQPGEGSAESASLRPDPLMQALHDVPVPAGLERRLLESLAPSGSPALDVNDALHGDADPKAFPTSPARKPRRRLAETMNVKAIVKSDGKLYSTEKEVKVTIGGCGG